MSLRNGNHALRCFAALASASAVYSVVHAADSIPPEIDAARVSEYRAVVTMAREIDDIQMSDFLREKCLSWKLSKATRWHSCRKHIG